MATRSPNVAHLPVATEGGPPGPDTGPTVIISGPALEAYFSLSPEAMCIVDRDGTLVAANTSCDDLFGTLPGALVGRPLVALFAVGLDRAELLAGLEGSV